MASRKNQRDDSAPEVAANGLIDRRALLGRGVLIAGAMGAGVQHLADQGRAAEPLPVDAWSLEIGTAIPPYDRPAKYEKNVVRTLTNPKNEPRTSQARTPHHLLNGTITPNGLHFVVSRTGFPDIDPDKHRLVIHGLVKQPLVFTLEALARYPMVSRINFVECGGNSAPLYNKDPVRGQRAGDPRSRFLLRVDWGAAFHSARRDGHRPEGEVAARGRGRRSQHEPQHSQWPRRSMTR